MFAGPHGGDCPLAQGVNDGLVVQSQLVGIVPTAVRNLKLKKYIYYLHTKSERKKYKTEKILKQIQNSIKKQLKQG